MQPRPAGKPGGFVNVTTNYSLGAVSVTTNNANLLCIDLKIIFGFDYKREMWFAFVSQNLSKTTKGVLKQQIYNRFSESIHSKVVTTV